MCSVYWETSGSTSAVYVYICVYESGRKVNCNLSSPLSLSLSLSLQIKEQAIKKQYNDTVRIQHRQYKALEEQVKMAVPRDRHKEVLRQTREERMRKIAMLAMQYERTISEMAQQQTVRHEMILLQLQFFSLLV